MPLFEPQNQVPGAPPNLPIPAPSTPPPPPPPPPMRSLSSMPTMPPAAPSAFPEPEDIFSKTSAGAKGPQFPQTLEAAASIAESPAKGLGRKLVRLLFLALGATVIVTAGYFGWNYIMSSWQRPQSTPDANINDQQPNSNENTNDQILNSNENIPANIPALNENVNLPTIDMTTDSDNDGLVDYEETNVYHTDQLASDTDADGLSDRYEANVYHTDPLNKDTDNDTYNDGAEVANGYNPLGPGKLSPPVIQ